MHSRTGALSIGHHRGITRRLARSGALLAGVALSLAFLGGLAGCGGVGSTSADELRALLSKGQREEAARRASAFVAGSPEEWTLLAQVFAGLRGFEDAAIERFRPLAEQGDPSAVLLAARVAADADRPGIGIEWLREARDRFPDVDELAIEQAKLLGRLDRHRESVAVLAPLAKSDPRLLNLTGYAWLLAGDVDKARAFLERSIEEASRAGRPYAPPHYHLGLLESQVGDLERALEHLVRAIEANPDHLEAHYQLLAVAERASRGDLAERARAGFARINGARLSSMGATLAEGGNAPVAVYRGESWETRVVVSEREFTRTVPAGSRLAFACRAPRGARALFDVETSDGTSLLSVVHEGGADEGIWYPHEIDVPAGGESIELRFGVAPASGFDRLLGRAPAPGAAFSEPAALAGEKVRSADSRPNILLFSLDTLRADRVGAYGAGRETTPAIDALAASGVRFARAIAPSNWTLPSHYSLFSGLTPVAHGVLPDLGEVRGYIHPDEQLAVRGSGVEVMLAEALAEAGYHTASITENGWVSGHFGFDQGFGSYRSAPAGSLPGTLAASLAELERIADRGPWFLFVHTYAPHQPYHAPLDIRTRWADPEHAGFAWPRARVPIEDYNRFRSRVFPPAASDVTAFRDLYDGQALWTDSLVGELVRFLDRKGLREQTVVIVTSDHGEEIFERGQFDHGDTLYEEVAHVPLIVDAPGRIPRGVVVEGAVSLVDVPATVLDLVGLADVHGQGSTLRPLWEADERESDRLVFAQAIGHGSEPVHGIWRGMRKYLRREAAAGVREECYDLAVDPGEKNDLSRSGRCDLQAFRAWHEEHLKTSSTIREALGSAEGGRVDPETLERLKSLGYAR